VQNATDEEVSVRLLPKEDDVARMFHTPKPRPNMVAPAPDRQPFGEPLAGHMERGDVPFRLGVVPTLGGVFADLELRHVSGDRRRAVPPRPDVVKDAFQ